MSCALFDEEGRLVSNAPHMPVHLGSMGESVRSVIVATGSELKPGDTIMLNSPYNGGTHLPDITVVTPWFAESDKPLFFLASRAHHADIGGITPGSMPSESHHIDEEGVLIDNFWLVRAGELQQDAVSELLTGAKYPVRNLRQNIADLKAQLAGLSRKPFVDILSDMMMSAPSPEAIKAFAEEHPDRWTNAVRVMANLSGYHDKLEIEGNISIEITNSGDADLMAMLEDINQKLGIKEVLTIDHDTVIDSEDLEGQPDQETVRN